MDGCSALETIAYMALGIVGALSLMAYCISDTRAKREDEIRRRVTAELKRARQGDLDVIRRALRPPS